MKIVNAISGKISTCVNGPKHYLKEYIRLGEVALCIGRDEKKPNQPYIWIIGGREQIIDFVALGREKGEINEIDANLLLTKLDEAKKHMPKTAMDRLASALGMETSDLLEITNVAQVCVSAPIEGIKDYSETKPIWVPKAAHASIH